jgi:hypothetical protein
MLPLAGLSTFVVSLFLWLRWFLFLEGAAMESSHLFLKGPAGRVVYFWFWLDGVPLHWFIDEWLD